MKEVFTIGHSTKSFEDFVRILKAYGIEILIDVRHFPHSRKFPWFNTEFLRENLIKEGINYVWIEKLGGFRKGGYLKYMESEEWKEGFEELRKIAEKKRVCIMCSEWKFWKCHRKHIAEKLSEEFEVMHIIDERKCVKHNSEDERLKSKIRCD